MCRCKYCKIRSFISNKDTKISSNKNEVSFKKNNETFDIIFHKKIDEKVSESSNDITKCSCEKDVENCKLKERITNNIGISHECVCAVVSPRMCKHTPHESIERKLWVGFLRFVNHVCLCQKNPDDCIRVLGENADHDPICILQEDNPERAKKCKCSLCV